MLAYIGGMEHPHGPVIDMTPDGQFIEPPKPSILSYLLRLALFGVALAVIVTLFWTLVLLIPLLLLVGAVGFFLFRPKIVTLRGARRF